MKKLRIYIQNQLSLYDEKPGENIPSPKDNGKRSCVFFLWRDIYPTVPADCSHLS